MKWLSIEALDKILNGLGKEQKCHLKFKDEFCQYRGDIDSCDKTYESCLMKEHFNRASITLNSTGEREIGDRDIETAEIGDDEIEVADFGGDSIDITEFGGARSFWGVHKNQNVNSSSRVNMNTTSVFFANNWNINFSGNIMLDNERSNSVSIEREKTGQAEIKKVEIEVVKLNNKRKFNLDE